MTSYLNHHAALRNSCSVCGTSTRQACRDANKGLRVLPSAIRPLVARQRMVGRAVTAAANGDLMSVIGGAGARRRRRRAGDFGRHRRIWRSPASCSARRRCGAGCRAS